VNGTCIASASQRCCLVSARAVAQVVGTAGGEGEITFAVKYRRGEIRLEYLRTYEHIGKATVRVEDVSDTDLCQHLERAPNEGVDPLHRGAAGPGESPSTTDATNGRPS
jgi:hypothetical protein